MPLFEPPFFDDDPGATRVPQQLAQEHSTWPTRRRRREERKLALRRLLLLLTGQRRLLCTRVPTSARRVLWLYDWTTVGDSLMDLAARMRIPAHITLDLLIAPHLAGLFRHDPRFAAVHTAAADCAAQAYDLVLLQVLSTTVLRSKRQHFRSLPFASVLPPVAGEQFNRIALGNLRIEALFGLQAAAPLPPSLHLGPPASGTLPAGRTHVAVALGARDARRSFGRWHQLLPLLQQRWPGHQPPPLFHLLGSGNARHDRLALAPEFLQTWCADQVDALPLEGTAAVVAQCQHFLGADGGLLHVATALGRPGLALFAGIQPNLRLLPGMPMAALHTPGVLADLPVQAVADAFLASLGLLDGVA